MSIARHHAEWLSLVEVSGPFLSLPVLMRLFPQGLDAHDPEQFRLLRQAYEEWEDEQQKPRRQNPAVHANWIRFVLRTILGFSNEAIAEGQAIAQTLHATIAEHGEVLRPNLVIKNPENGKPRLLIQTYPSTQDLGKPVSGQTWKASPDTRMMELLHATDVRLGLVTNGEQWMLVDAPRNETTGFASWYAHLWIEEKITLQAFSSLFSAHRFFGVPDTDTLEAMVAESASNQQEVTDQLGYQVRKAVEVLVQCLDRADQDADRKLLADVSEAELYEAALTIMMRLVFLFCAEERGLVLLGDPLYDQHYAVSTLEAQLRETADQHGEEILERRHDAWCRLLSTFRTVYGGVVHEQMTLPAYGGKLFDPDRFAFLEGRQKGTAWRVSPANPLPINNRAVLHLLDALQLLQVKVPGGGPAEARRLSFRALDIEQIGHVYEGLLDHTAKRATEPVVGLVGSKDREPEIALSTLEQMWAKGEAACFEYLHEQTGRSANALKKALQAKSDLVNLSHFEAACGGGTEGKKLFDRIKPFVGLVRDNTFGYPVVICTGSIYVTAGTDRRSSGTHYTPKSLTEPIVQYTLEPLVYVGPAEGHPKEQWKLRPVAELLDLKICDMACGSGAFLVQACRYMSERLLEAWELAEKSLPKGTPGITPDGTASTGQPNETILSGDPDERRAFARRIVAQRCLYGVDINPLAAEMAKLSLWLLTLAKDKPFTFLDHAVRCGDSLLGIHDLKQLKTFSLDGTGQQYVFGQEPLDELVDKAIELRLKIESMPSNSVEDIDAQAGLMVECEQQMEFLNCAADMLIAAELKGGSPRQRMENRDHAAVQIGHYLNGGKHGEFRAAATKELGRRSLHWPLEFPEIVSKRGGFDAFVGNPPFMGGTRIRASFGLPYLNYLSVMYGSGNRADFCTYFLLRGYSLLSGHGRLGFVTTNTICQGDSRELGLDSLLAKGCIINRAVSSREWPGTASLQVSFLWLSASTWAGDCLLDGASVQGIGSYLTPMDTVAGVPHRLCRDAEHSFNGVKIYGQGFLLAPDDVPRLTAKNPRNRDVLFPYLNGDDLNSRPDQSPSRWAINFFDWPLDRTSAPPGYDGRVASDYPDCLEIVSKHVRPERTRRNPDGTYALRKPLPQRWWIYGDRRPALECALKSVPQTLVIAETTKHCIFVFCRPTIVFSHMLKVLAFADFGHFTVLQSNVHEAWARQHSSTLEDRLKYNPTDCFETFPFPVKLDVLDDIGQRYHAHRSIVTSQNHQGLTDVYNRFHDPAEAATDIQKLRDLHAEMDKAVAAAYGWDDLRLGHDFQQTKQGLRFTISEPARREVLARLLKLNHQRYAEEVAQGLHDKKAKPTKARTRTVSTQPAADLDLSLFTMMTYPATEADRAICAAFLGIVEQTTGIDSAANLTTLLLATHPDWCRAFLSPADCKRLDAVKRAPAAPVISEGTSIRWKDARDHLELRKAIKIDRGSPEQRITGTPALSSVKATLPGPMDEVVALALAAAESIGRLRQQPATVTLEQKRLMGIFQKEAKAMGLGAA